MGEAELNPVLMVNVPTVTVDAGSAFFMYLIKSCRLRRGLSPERKLKKADLAYVAAAWRKFGPVIAAGAPLA